MNTRERIPIITFLACVLFFTFFSIPSYTADAAGTGETPSGIPCNRLEQEIDSYVNSQIGQSTPGAAVVVTKGDKIIFSKGYGYADIGKRTPVDPAGTVFAYGSINKAFVLLLANWNFFHLTP
ncbi:serine hydrolase [Paenibacillus sp. FSL L8-0436]|uniref:serine hydrolase n=1 Tax=Paenibacillus sp. FSL L8-0436 TaxID=2954686 RepID=UPI003158268A